ncbi:MAG TPA: hypothetical protein VMT75_04520 [Candidatus Saccharimonadales bacterium]|nr:hypothetical protein [Candidatus Saccharimonadales bacterium]
MFASFRPLLAASALLLATLPAVAAEENNPGSIAPSAVNKATVKCPGIKNVPMTSDAEQSLPLQVVENLACGSRVVVLQDTEGYTAQVRTIDGKEGFVALMYLAPSADAPAPEPAPVPSTATPVNGVVRWRAGAPGCDEFLSHGRHVESITANGITVQVSLQDSGWKYRANVAVSNQTGSSVDVQPGIITLDELEPLLRALPATDVDKIAHTSTHQVLWTLADATPSPSAIVQTSAKSTAADRLSHRSNPTSDYMNPHMTLASARPGSFDRTEPIDIERIALKPIVVKSQQNTAGVMWFARDERANELSLRVPVGGVVFDFAFAFEDRGK